jgi:hypothetical protein
MASNFKIAIHRNDENLHLRLMGDFDDSSAWDLLNGLKKHCHGINRIFIHTNCLKHLHSFGREILQKNLSSVIGTSTCVVFTGEKATQLAPEGHKEAELEKRGFYNRSA